MTTEQQDIIDKLIIHLAQSKAYMGGGGKLAWRLRSGKATKKDLENTKWAMEFLKRYPIYISTMESQINDKKTA